MGFFSRSSRPTIERTWRYTPGGILWRIVPAGGGRIIGEGRTENLKDVRFFCLEERTGRILWADRDFGLGWWCGIEGYSSSVVFLHGFASPDLPFHRSVYAVDIETGEMLWSDEQLRFARAFSDRLYAEGESGGRETLIDIDPRTGSHRHTWKEGEAIPDAVRNHTEAGGDGVPVFPAPLASLEAEMPEIGVHVRRICASTGPGASAEVLVERGLIVTGCTAISGEAAACRITSTMNVLHRDSGRVLYCEDVSAPGRAYAPDAFYVRDDMLVYIRERTMLTGADLASAQRFIREGKER
jgi:hypothetical protein